MTTNADRSNSRASSKQRRELERELTEILLPAPDWWLSSGLADLIVSTLYRLSVMADRAGNRTPRTASIEFLGAVYRTVDVLHRRGRAGLFVDSCAMLKGTKRRKGDHDFALLMRALVPHEADRKIRSKWANLLWRAFVEQVPSDVLTERVRRKGGISAYAESLARRSSNLADAANRFDDLPKLLRSSPDDAEPTRRAGRRLARRRS